MGALTAAELDAETLQKDGDAESAVLLGRVQRSREVY